MKHNKRKLLMVGLPETGKTTYLAALWYVVNNPDEVNGALKLDCLPANAEYLNMISEQWITYSKVERTGVAFDNIVSMTLKHTPNSSPIEIFIPDVSGEVFREQIEERHCTEDFYKNIEESDGILLFIHCGEIKPLQTIGKTEEIVKIIQEHPSDAENNPEGTPIEWTPSLMPTQVKLIELLQFILDAPNLKKPHRVAVVLSAWDLILGLNITPSCFLKTRLPMLAHFLEANDEVIVTQCYGISAQGCPYDNDKARIDLAKKTNSCPSSKILVQNESSSCSDITEPIKWLIETHVE